MFFKFKKYVMIVFFSVSIFTIAKPLHETTAKILSIAGGVVAGVGSGALVYYVIEDHAGQIYRIPFSVVSGVGGGVLTWYFLNEWLYRKTPTARIFMTSYLMNNINVKIDALEKKLSNIFTEKIVAKKFSNDTDFFSNIIAHFGTSWPLVCAREYLTNLPPMYNSNIDNISFDLEEVLVILNFVIQEMHGKAEYASLLAIGEKINQNIKNMFSKCNDLKSVVQNLALMIENPLKAIVNHEKFAFQVELYEKYCAEERQREFDRLEAMRQREHELSLEKSKQHHSSSQQFFAQVHESKENKKKYQNQQNILHQNHNRPVTLNVG